MRKKKQMKGIFAVVVFGAVVTVAGLFLCMFLLISESLEWNYVQSESGNVAQQGERKIDLYEYFHTRNRQGQTGLFALEKDTKVSYKDMGEIFAKTEKELQEDWLLREAFREKQIEKFVWAIAAAEKRERTGLTFHAGNGEGKADLELSIVYRGEELVIRKFPWTGEGSCEELWEVCTEALNEESTDSWEHDTYRIYDDIRGYLTNAQREAVGHWLLLYHTQQGEGGFFYEGKDSIYQVVMPKGRDCVTELQRIRQHIMEGSALNAATMWEDALWEVMKDKKVENGFTWHEERIRNQVYQAVDGVFAVLSREQITGLSELTLKLGGQSKAGRIENIQDLQKLSGLKTLVIDGEVSIYSKSIDGYPMELDLQGSWLPDLTTLEVINCGLTDISFVKEFPYLTSVSFSNNLIQDISPLSDCSKLTELNLAENQVEDLSPLREQAELVVLEVQHNKIQDISALADLTGLVTLEVQENQIQDISALAGMTQLEQLNLKDNQIQDFTPIFGKKKLYSLNIAYNPGGEIGDLIFVPDLYIDYLRVFYAEDEDEAAILLTQVPYSQSIKWTGTIMEDINGDGIMDQLLVGFDEREGKKNVYLFLGTDQGEYVYLQKAAVTEWDYYGERISETAVMVTGDGLMCQSHETDYQWWDHVSRNVYEWENGRLILTWSMNLLRDQAVSDDTEWIVIDRRTGEEKKYIFQE